MIALIETLIATTVTDSANMNQDNLNFLLSKPELFALFDVINATVDMKNNGFVVGSKIIHRRNPLGKTYCFELYGLKGAMLSEEFILAENIEFVGWVPWKKQVTQKGD